MSLSFQSFLWGLLAGSALILGSLVGYLASVPRRVIAGVMAFGSGVLISTLAFDLMDKAYEQGGFDSAGTGFVTGAVVYTGINIWLGTSGATHRKRSGRRQPSERESAGSGLAIAAGALLDGIPESMVIGLSLVAGGTVSLVAVVAIFLSNVPEGLSSAAGMKQAGRSAFYVFGVWGAIAVISGMASWIGFAAFNGASPDVVAAITAIAAGAVLAMISDTMIPEAFEETHDYTGLITVIGFFLAFALSKVMDP